jgi:hypothetical protein
VTAARRFNSALLLNIHYHALVPNGVFEKETGRFLELPPPDDEEVEVLLEKVATRTVRLLRRRGLLDEEAFPEDGLQACQAASLQQRLPLFSAEEENPTDALRARPFWRASRCMHIRRCMRTTGQGWRGCVVTEPEAP